jgi:hypothetical protein
MQYEDGNEVLNSKEEVVVVVVAAAAAVVVVYLTTRFQYLKLKPTASNRK